jgi:uracil-DNA glycosylase
MIIPDKVHPSWHDFLDSSISELLGDIGRKLTDEPAGAITPPFRQMLRFLELDLLKAKVVIIGQDPYPQPGVATGRAFEVGPLGSWTDSFRNASLRNIVRTLYAAKVGKVKKYSEIKKELEANRFSLLPPNLLFKHWEKQGVLLLNTSFSCRVGKPGSHATLWNVFTKSLLAYINQSNSALIWFLWGNHAREVVSHLTLARSIETTHPMICHQRPNDFLFGDKNVFKETMDLVDWFG